MRRAIPDLSDIDLAGLLYRGNHLFGRARLQAIYDPERSPKLRVYNMEDADPSGSYVIYSETDQRFIGISRKGSIHMQEPGSGDSARLVFFPAAQA